MNKKLSFLLAIGLVVLTACGSDNTSSSDQDETESEETTSANTDTSNETKESNDEADSVFDAEAGERVVDGGYGEFNFSDVINVNEHFTSGPIEGNFESVKAGTFSFDDENKETINIVTTVIKTENTSDDEASFHSFSATLTTDTGNQIDAEMMLNGGESSHIGQVRQEQFVSYNLGDESIDDIGELNFHFKSTSIDNRSVDDDFTITVNP